MITDRSRYFGRIRSNTNDVCNICSERPAPERKRLISRTHEFLATHRGSATPVDQVPSLSTPQHRRLSSRFSQGGWPPGILPAAFLRDAATGQGTADLLPLN